MEEGINFAALIGGIILLVVAYFIYKNVREEIIRVVGALIAGLLGIYLIYIAFANGEADAAVSGLTLLGLKKISL